MILSPSYFFAGIAKDILLVHIKTLPLFIGAVSSAYEGVGTIIPIESSMQVKVTFALILAVVLHCCVSLCVNEGKDKF